MNPSSVLSSARKRLTFLMALAYKSAYTNMYHLLTLAQEEA